MLFCQGCGVSLHERGQVVRRYSGYDGVPVFGGGHYGEGGDFEPDEAVDLPDGSQTVDGDDRCFTCSSVVG